MKSIWSASIAILGGVAFAGGEPQAFPLAGPPVAESPASMHLAGNTSSNSSSNTSSNSSARGSSYVHTHNWSVDSDDDVRRRSVRGSTRIERYVPAPNRHRRPRAVYQHFSGDDD